MTRSARPSRTQSATSFISQSASNEVRSKVMAPSDASSTASMYSSATTWCWVPSSAPFASVNSKVSSAPPPSTTPSPQAVSPRAPVAAMAATFVRREVSDVFMYFLAFLMLDQTGQVQDDVGDEEEDGDQYQVDEEEGHDAAEDGFRSDAGGARHDEGVDAHWWGDHADFDEFHDQDTQPDGIEAEFEGHRQQQGHGDDQQGQGFQDHAQWDQAQ